MMVPSPWFLACLFLPVLAQSFTPGSGRSPKLIFGIAEKRAKNEISRPPASFRVNVLYMSKVDVTFPTPDEAAAMGARDWPQQVKSGSWTETFGPGQEATRYVLEGSGSLEVKTFDDEGSMESGVVSKSKVGPGTLVEVSGRADLVWQIDGQGEMIILTPGYEEGGLLLGVAAVLVVLCGALIAGVGS
mmetsp:Transcript_19977/g.40478  ORF Transcript_19977/g.40478 Transcript_19977/m.40478 type:complete len:188 (-) Transcript_19977:111-674(-)